MFSWILTSNVGIKKCRHNAGYTDVGITCGIVELCIFFKLEYLVYIRDILGHVSIQTTDIYARADSKAKREALEKAYTNITPTQCSDKAWEDNKNLKDST